MAFNQIEQSFTYKKVTYWLDTSFTQLEKLITKNIAVIITDENVYAHYKRLLDGWNVIVIKPGEQYKQQTTVDYIITEFIKRKIYKKNCVVGLGGGVVTDIVGYVASIYMRGLPFGFIPTTILGMVDAAIGGKNGIDVGLYKNMMGTIRQPDFLLYDYNFLQTLPHEQWVNGFAEIIKHVCIKDAALFSRLEQHSIADFKNDKKLLSELIEENVQIKTTIVLQDEFEKNERKLLNFGHTFGHAIENKYNLLHGHAISIGMIIAATISEKVNNFSIIEKERLIQLLKKYELPVSTEYDTTRVIEMMQLDKKRTTTAIDFVLLNKIGEAVIKSIPVELLKSLLIS